LKKRTVHRQLPRLPPLKKHPQLKKPPKQLQKRVLRLPPKHPLPKRTSSLYPPDSGAKAMAQAAKHHL